MLVHYLNGNVLKVQKILTHKRVESTMKYIQILNLEGDDFEVTSASTLEEIKKVGITGWVKCDEIIVNGMQVTSIKSQKSSQMSNTLLSEKHAYKRAIYLNKLLYGCC